MTYFEEMGYKDDEDYKDGVAVDYENSKKIVDSNQDEYLMTDEEADFRSSYKTVVSQNGPDDQDSEVVQVDYEKYGDTTEKKDEDNIPY